MGLLLWSGVELKATQSRLGLTFVLEVAVGAGLGGEAGMRRSLGM